MEMNRFKVFQKSSNFFDLILDLSHSNRDLRVTGLSTIVEKEALDM